MAIWITSDWHFCHNKSFLYEPRGFNSTEEMNEAIITYHNEVVKPDDEVWHLGDEILSDIDSGIKCIKRLNGKIHLIRGNHSTDNKIARIAEECPNVVDIGKWADLLQYRKWKFFLSHYRTLCDNLDDGDKPLKRRTLNLCGHTHTKDRWYDFDKGLIMHVEMDTNNCRPYLIDEVIELFQKKVLL